jgi:TRAP-type C4-dicarboxylate transport system permease large subunit
MVKGKGLCIRQGLMLAGSAVVRMIGLITPPVGVALFAVSAVTEVPFRQMARDIWPYVIALLCVPAIVTYMPGLILWVPNRLMGGVQ